MIGSLNFRCENICAVSHVKVSHVKLLVNLSYGKLKNKNSLTKISHMISHMISHDLKKLFHCEVPIPHRNRNFTHVKKCENQILCVNILNVA